MAPVQVKINIQATDKATVEPGETSVGLEELTKEQQSARHKQLIDTLSEFKPMDATPLQYYNFLREYCILHNCCIDEGIARARDSWAMLPRRNRKLYSSVKHAELPIPVPTHKLYRAFQMEREGRWVLGKAPVGDKGGTMYTVTSYKPPRKPIGRTVIQFDNMAPEPYKAAAIKTRSKLTRNTNKSGPTLAQKTALASAASARQATIGKNLETPSKATTPKRGTAARFSLLAPSEPPHKFRNASSLSLRSMPQNIGDQATATKKTMSNVFVGCVSKTTKKAQMHSKKVKSWEPKTKTAPSHNKPVWKCI